MFSTSKSAQCRKCWKFGHMSHCCPNTLQVCPVSSLAHIKAEHRCPNLSCPKGGNLQPILDCCPSSVACCPNCQEGHSAHTRDCPWRPRTAPDAPNVLSRETQDSYDLAEDQAGPSTVIRTAPGASPQIPSTPVLRHNALQPRQSAHRTITDLAPR